MNEIVILIIIGLLAGLTGGTLGVGGGIIVIPALAFVLGYSQHVAQGTSLAMMIPPIGLVAAYKYYQNDYINFKAAIILVIAFVIGSYFGSMIAANLSARTLQKIFAVFLFLAAIKLFIGK